MSVRRDLFALQERTDRRIDRLQMPLSRAVGAAVRQHADETPQGPRLTPFGRLLVLRTVEAELDRIYGRWPNDPSSPLYALVVRSARYAAFLAVSAAWEDVKRRIRDPEILRYIEGGAQ